MTRAQPPAGAWVIAIRSTTYHLAFFLNVSVFCLIGIPLFVLPRSWGIPVMKLWARSSGWLLAWICGLRYEVRNPQNMPRGAALVASKHQSAWETIAFLHLFPDPAMILKREIALIPLFGWYALKFGNLALDRSGGGGALRQLIRAARATVTEGRQVVIFPEGTRRPLGAPPDYQRGVVALYRSLDTGCVPVALNSGVFWRRRGFLRLPGTIIVEFLPAIPPGLDSETFLATLVERIETATGRLIEDAAMRDAA